MKNILSITLILIICIEIGLSTRLRLKFKRRRSDIDQSNQAPQIPTNDEINKLTTVVLEGWMSVKSQSFNSDRYQDIKVKDQERSVEIIEKSDIDAKVTPQVLFPGFRKNEDFGGEGSDVPGLDKFYFRLSGNNIYYTKNDKDLVVLGAINVKNIQNVQNMTRAGQNCLMVNDLEKDIWQICAETGDVQQKWYCQIKDILKDPCPAADQEPVKVTNEIKEEVILYQLPSPNCNENWNYQHHGADWDCICNEGLKQSPIDLNPNQTCNPYEVAPFTKFEFKDMKLDEWKIYYEDNLIRVTETGTTNPNFGTIQMVGKQTFEGKEIQFHTPSDHQIGGKRFDMEIQAIYQTSNSNGNIEKAVLSFLVTIEPGRSNDFINALDLTKIPNTVQTESAFLARGIKKIKLSDMWNSRQDNTVFKSDFSFFHYEGSLSSPQCDENVYWFIVAEPFLIGNAYVTMIKDALTSLPDLTEDSQPDASYDNRNSEGTYRQLQQINGRQVYYHQKCSDDGSIEKKDDYHFEVVQNDAEYLYYTSQDKPTGITGSKVIKMEDVIKTLKQEKLEQDKTKQH